MLLRRTLGGAVVALFLAVGVVLGIPAVMSGGVSSGGILENPARPSVAPSVQSPEGQLRPTVPSAGPPASLPASPPADPPLPDGTSAAPPADPPGTLPADPPPPNGLPDDLDSPDPLTALPALAEVRASAFTGADSARLDLANVSGSPAMSADIEAVSALSESGRRLNGLSVAIEQATQLSGTPGSGADDGDAGIPADGTRPVDTVSIAARAAVSGYTEVADDGAPVSGWMAAETQDLVFVLRNDGGGWKIYSVHEPENADR